LVLGLVLGFGAGSFTSLPVEELSKINFSDKIEADSGTSGSSGLDIGGQVSIREIKNSPVKYEGEVVTVQGGSNSFADFIKSDGYSLPMDCSSYPDFDYASQFKVEVVVELQNPGVGDPRLRCVGPPKAVGAYQ
jgi:hypothetical protein